MVRRRYDPKVEPGKTTPSPKGQKQYRDSNYYKERGSDEKGKTYPTFSHSKVDQIITEFSDGNYLTCYTMHVDHTTANSKTAFKNYAIAVVTEGRIAGNMKDKVDADETAYSVVAVNAFMVLFDLAFDLLFRELTSGGFTENDANSTTTYPSLMTQKNFDISVAAWEEKGLIVPNWVRDLVKEMVFCVKLNDGFVNGKTHYPPRYFLPFIADMTLAQRETFVAEWATNNLKARTHMDKFGVKYSLFTRSMIENAPELKKTDPKVISYLSHCPLHFTKVGPAAEMIMATALEITGDKTTAWTGQRFWFPRSEKGPNQPGRIFDIFHMFFDLYDATNNPYGGILSVSNLTNTVDHIAMAQMAYDGTVLVVGTIDYFYDIPMMFWAAWAQSNTFNLTYTGTYMTATTLDVARWPLAVDNDLVYGTGLSWQTQHDIMKTWAILRLSSGAEAAPEVPANG